MNENELVRTHLAHSLLDVFVTIEMTGQGVQFEQKFNYRHTMYQTLHQMHQLRAHRDALCELSAEALVCMRSTEASEQPLFLRFINLLMNDANYLLDEILKHIHEVKQREVTRAQLQQRGERPSQEDEQAYRTEALLSRLYNQLGNPLAFPSLPSCSHRILFAHFLFTL